MTRTQSQLEGTKPQCGEYSASIEGVLIFSIGVLSHSWQGLQILSVGLLSLGWGVLIWEYSVTNVHFGECLLSVVEPQ